MASTKRKNSGSAIPKEKYSVRQALTNYYLLIMFTLFPLFFTDAYFNIRHDKYYFFIILTGILVVAEFLIVMTASVDKPSEGQKLEKPKPKHFYEVLSFMDRAFIAFLGINVISTLLSESPSDALFGTQGRNNGLILMAFYTAAYFMITRCFKYFEYIFVALAFGSIVVYALAILNAFYVDPLGMFTQLSNQQTIANFTSTIGNKNLLSSYICIALPVMIAMSVITEKTVLRAIYLVASGFGFAALMTADSDSGILGIGVFMVIYLIWFSKKVVRLKRFFLSTAFMLLFAKLLRLFSLFFDDRSKGLDQFQEIFVYSNVGWILLAVCAVITALLYVLDFKKPNITLSKAVPIALTVIFGLCAAALIGIVIYFSCIDTETDLGSFGTILRFNDKWGTHRGFMWIRSIRIFGDASFLKKLFGVGPDMFYCAFTPYFDDLSKYGDGSTNAAHNEYLNYLITIGITGLLSYLAIVGGTIKNAVKYAKENPMLIVCVSAVICYAVQSVVNLYQPITTPLFFIFIALCEAFVRNTKAEKSAV